MDIRRRVICYANLCPIIGSEQGGIRPVLIVQNDLGNVYSPTTIVVNITFIHKRELPTYVLVHKNDNNGLKTDSIVLTE